MFVFTPQIKNYFVEEKVVMVNVLTPEEKTQQISVSVQDLTTSGVLDQGLANSLTVKLNAATQNLNNENTQAATGELNAFINEVEADVQNGQLTPTEGQALIKDANTVINAINNISNSPAISVPEFPSIVLPVVALLGLVVVFARKKNE